MCVCVHACACFPLSEHLEVSWSLGILEKEPLREVNIHVTGRPHQALHSSDGLLAGRTLSPLFSHPNDFFSLQV